MDTNFLIEQAERHIETLDIYELDLILGVVESEQGLTYGPGKLNLKDPSLKPLIYRFFRQVVLDADGMYRRTFPVGFEDPDSYQILKDAANRRFIALQSLLV